MTTKELYPLTRRSVMKSAAAIGAVSAFGGAFGPGFVGRARADSHDGLINTCGATLDIVLALDYSGSIGSGLWDDIQSGAESFVDVLADDNQLGLVTFGDTAKAYDFDEQVFLMLAQDGATDNRPTLKSAIPGTAPPNENATHMAAALDFSNDILDVQGRGEKEVIILLTDGSPNYQNGTVGDGASPPQDEGSDTVGGVSGYVPSSTKDFDPDNDGANTYPYTGGTSSENAIITESERQETEDVATAAKSDGTRIVAVGIGSGVDDAFLSTRVASDPDDYVQVSDSSEIGTTLQDLLSDICEEECVTCEEDGLLVKYEFECVEEVDDECVRWDFVPEGEGDEGISYTAGSFDSKEGEEYEPMSVTFETDYCDLYVLVKSGQEFEVQSFEDNGGSITVDSASEKFAISFVAFYCDEDAANDARDTFPSNVKGGNGGRANRR